MCVQADFLAKIWQQFEIVANFLMIKIVSIHCTTTINTDEFLVVAFHVI